MKRLLHLLQSKSALHAANSFTQWRRKVAACAQIADLNSQAFRALRFAYLHFYRFTHRDDVFDGRLKGQCCRQSSFASYCLHHKSNPLASLFLVRDVHVLNHHPYQRCTRSTSNQLAPDTNAPEPHLAALRSH